MKIVLSVLIGIYVGIFLSKIVWGKALEEHFTNVKDTVSQSCLNELRNM